MFFVRLIAGLHKQIFNVALFLNDAVWFQGLINRITN